jgi:hypothetical protein
MRRGHVLPVALQVLGFCLVSLATVRLATAGDEDCYVNIYRANYGPHYLNPVQALRCHEAVCDPAQEDCNFYSEYEGSMTHAWCRCGSSGTSNSCILKWSGPNLNGYGQAFCEPSCDAGQTCNTTVSWGNGTWVGFDWIERADPCPTCH